MGMNQHQAYLYCLNYLTKEGYQPQVLNRNQFGHTLITTNKGKFYLIYKKEYLMSFNNLFSEYIKENNALSGIGESINIEYLQYAINNHAIVLFIHEDGKIYTIDKIALNTILNIAFFEDYTHLNTSQMIKVFCEYHKLKRTQTIQNERKMPDYDNNTCLVQESTYSFPVRLLKRFDI